MTASFVTTDPRFAGPARGPSGTTFQPGPAAFVGSVVLGTMGAVLAIFALALVAAWAADARGLVSRPADHELIGRLVTTVPLLLAIAGLHLLGAAGTIAGRPWARTQARVVAAVGLVLMAILFVGVAGGSDPFAAASAAGADVARSDGMGIVALAGGLYLFATILLAPTDR